MRPGRCGSSCAQSCLDAILPPRGTARVAAHAARLRRLHRRRRASDSPSPTDRRGDRRAPAQIWCWRSPTPAIATTQRARTALAFLQRLRRARHRRGNSRADRRDRPPHRRRGARRNAEREDTRRHRCRAPPPGHRPIAALILQGRPRRWTRRCSTRCWPAGFAQRRPRYGVVLLGRGSLELLVADRRNCCCRRRTAQASRQANRMPRSSALARYRAAYCATFQKQLVHCGGPVLEDRCRHRGGARRLLGGARTPAATLRLAALAASHRVLLVRVADDRTCDGALAVWFDTERSALVIVFELRLRCHHPLSARRSAYRGGDTERHQPLRRSRRPSGIHSPAALGTGAGSALFRRRRWRIIIVPAAAVICRQRRLLLVALAGTRPRRHHRFVLAGVILQSVAGSAGVILAAASRLIPGRCGILG